MRNGVSFSLKIDEAGWADLGIGIKGRKLTVACSYVFDSLGDLVRAFAELASRDGAAEVRCLEEPGDVLVRLRRSAGRFYMSATRFSWHGDTAPKKLVDRAMHSERSEDWQKVFESRNKKATLRYEGPVDQAIASFTTAFRQAIEEIGINHYVERWKHPFPQEAWNRLQAHTL